MLAKFSIDLLLALGLSSNFDTQTTIAVASSVLFIIAVFVVSIPLIVLFYKRLFKQKLHSTMAKESEVGISGFANEAFMEDSNHVLSQVVDGNGNIYSVPEPSKEPQSGFVQNVKQ